MSTTPTFGWTPDDPTRRPLLDLLPGARVITAVGAGGKTSLINALADEASARGRRVLLTTTTHMVREPALITDVDLALATLNPVFVTLMNTVEPPAAPDATLRETKTGLVTPGPATPTPNPDVVPLTNTVEPQAASEASLRVTKTGFVIVVGREVADDKFTGPEASDLNRLIRAADLTVIEGDGSRRLPFKVPAAHEPVVPEATDVLLIVVGLTALGRPLAEVCCRLDEASRILETVDLGAQRPGNPGRSAPSHDPGAELLTPQLAASLIKAGYLDNPRLATWVGRRAVVLNQADDAHLDHLGRELAAYLPGELVLLASNRNPI
ncbi:selenium cofactor biosynthesis protein YqeC [Propioniciclava tarda]|uniref:selenium cofactor biosynthesis protein YqeC n=1 Tax=Propioniciclava tarda TaxID=433330 RepID=UPI0013F16C96|nr:selenium cofactor biosynthesis protein YqeC [Propioniciclava tarda]